MIKQNILITVDNVIFTIRKGQLQILLINRIIEPYKDQWALPGGFILEEETAGQAAKRELLEEANVKNVYLEQLYTFSDIDRDPRGRVVSVAYMALVNEKKVSLKAGSDAQEAKFFNINTLPTLAFDHKKIVDYAVKRLKYKLEYSNVAQYILPSKFKFSDLQEIYEIVFETQMDVRNFRKKIDKLDIIEDTGEKEEGVKHRPGKLFKFKTKKFEIVEII